MCELILGSWLDLYGEGIETRTIAVEKGGERSTMAGSWLPLDRVVRRNKMWLSRTSRSARRVDAIPGGRRDNYSLFAPATCGLRARRR
jgi:hypothetical protein